MDTEKQNNPPHVSPRRPNETELGYKLRVADTVQAHSDDSFGASEASGAVLEALELANETLKNTCFDDARESVQNSLRLLNTEPPRNEL